MDVVHRRLAQRIRLFAEQKGIVLTHVPDRAGVGQSQFWNVLAGRKSPTLRWIGRIATVLEIDAGKLVAPDLGDDDGHAQRDAVKLARSRRKATRRALNK